MGFTKLSELQLLLEFGARNTTLFARRLAPGKDKAMKFPLFCQYALFVGEIEFSFNGSFTALADFHDLCWPRASNPSTLPVIGQYRR